MGVTSSTASLVVHLDHPATYSGGTLSGTVYLEVRQEISATFLQISVSGMERSHTHWTTTHSSGSGKNRHTTTRHHHAYANRTLFGVSTPLAAYPHGLISPGMYVHPFIVPIPAGLPSTMHAAGDGGDCRVNYSVDAHLVRPGAFTSDIRSGEGFIVCSLPLCDPPFPFYATPATTRVTFCCCFDRGRATLGAAFDDTLAARGQTVGVNVAVRNESTVQPDSLFAQITEFVTWRAGGHSNSCARVVASTAFDPRTITGFARQSDAGARRSGGMVDAALLQEMHETLMTGKQRSYMSVVSDARETYAGAVLEVRHSMSIRMKMPCCVTDVGVAAPMRICGSRAVAAVLAAPSAPPAVAAYPAFLPADMVVQPSASMRLPAEWSARAQVAPLLTVPLAEAALGGTASEQPQSADGAAPPSMLPPPRASAPRTPSLHSLHELFDEAYDDFAMLQTLADSPADGAAWRAVFASLQPRDFGTLIAKVNLPFSRPKVAMFLASFLRRPLPLEYVIGTLVAMGYDVSETRASVANALLTLCDAAECKARRGDVERMLSPWERVVLGIDKL